MPLPNENNFYYHSVQHLARSLAKISSLSSEKVLIDRRKLFHLFIWLIFYWIDSFYSDKYIILVVSKRVLEWRLCDRPKRTRLCHSFSYIFSRIKISGNIHLNYNYFIAVVCREQLMSNTRINRIIVVRIWIW